VRFLTELTIAFIYLNCHDADPAISDIGFEKTRAKREEGTADQEEIGSILQRDLNSEVVQTGWPERLRQLAPKLLLRNVRLCNLLSPEPPFTLKTD
jgi:hypothetical protein